LRTGWRTAAVIVAFMIGVPAAAQEAAIEFEGDGAVVIEPGGMKTLTLVNNTATSFTLTLQAIDTNGATSKAFTVTGPPSVRAGGVAAVTVTASATDDAKGYLVAQATSSQRSARSPTTVVARRAIEVKSEATVLEPLVSEWNATSYRFKPGDELHNAVVPVKDAAECPLDAQPIAAGGITSSSGGGAAVTAECTTTDVYAGSVGMRLSFRGLRQHTGDYTGTIDLLPDDDDKGEVELSVRRTDYILLPLVALICGIGLALVATRQSGRLNILSEAEEDTWVLQSDAVSAERTFRERSRGTPWSTYTLQPGLDEALDAVRRRLGDLRRGFAALDENNPVYKEQIDRLRALRKTVTAWPAFAERLAVLNAALQAVNDMADTYRPPSTEDPLPAFVQPATALTIGSVLSDQDALDRIEEVELTASLAQDWLVHAKTVQKLNKLAKDIRAAMSSDNPEVTPERKAALARAEDKISEAHREMWRATDSSEYKQLGVAADLAEAASILDGLSHLLETLYAMGPEEQAVARGEAVPRPASALEGILAERALAPADIAREIAQRRRLRNALVFLGLALVTLWTGLTALYFDKPFGTPRDYLTMLAWGFGAQAGLAALAVAVDRVVSQRVPIS
jgi:hypothetical protein